MRAAPCQLIVGLAFGDEGKGTTVDFLARQALAAHHRPPLVVRYNGGPQAAHHVVNEHGQSHCFAQLGSASLIPGAGTLLSQHMLVEPLALLREAEALARLGVAAPLRQLSIDRRCVVVTPFHRLLNRMQELRRGAARHGSCGLGVGQAWLDSRNPSMPTLRLGEVQQPVELRRKLRFMQLCKVDLAEQLCDAHPELPALRTHLDELRQPGWVEHLAEGYAALLRELHALDDGAVLRRALRDPQQPILFEGAQGVLLDAERGFFPHVTPSCTTLANAQALLADADADAGAKLESDRPVQRIGVLRAYATRHGAGPFVTHDAELEARLPEQHNGTGPWQGAMRVGWFDAVAARYAIAAVGGVDSIALTNLDRLAGLAGVKVCTRYGLDGPELQRLPLPAARSEQIRLTEQLLRCQPIYDELPGYSLSQPLSPELEGLLRYLESAALGVPISLLSLGPAAADKQVRELGTVAL